MAMQLVLPQMATQVERTGSGLLHAALTRENLLQAFKRVRANKGAAGVGGLDIDQSGSYPEYWYDDKELLGILRRRSADRYRRLDGGPAPFLCHYFCTATVR